LFDLGEFVVGADEADLESFDLAESAFTLGFGDAGGEVVADLDESLALGGVGPEHGAADACLTCPPSSPDPSSYPSCANTAAGLSPSSTTPGPTGRPALNYTVHQTFPQLISLIKSAAPDN
jgi:hypothetical protein